MNLLIVLFFVIFDFIFARNSNEAAVTYRVDIWYDGATSAIAEMTVTQDSQVKRVQRIILPVVQAKSLLQSSYVESGDATLEIDDFVGSFEFELFEFVPYQFSSTLIDVPEDDERHFHFRYKIYKIKSYQNDFLVYDSRMPTFSNSEHCRNQFSCEVLFRRLGDSPWLGETLTVLDVSSHGSAPILDGYNGLSPTIVSIPSGAVLLFRFDGMGTLKSTHSRYIGFIAQNLNHRVTLYHEAYVTTVQLMNTFAAPTGGTTYPITSEQASAFALSISSQNYFIA